MILTPKQETAVKIAVERFKHGEKYTIISGFAGSGKSTSVRAIIDALQIPEEKIAYATYTGRAAQVLREKGCANAMTLHRLLYTCKRKKNGELSWVPKAQKDFGYSIVVVDEISMMPQSMLDLLLNFDVYLIGLGDPFQLPPISKDDANNLLDNPHVFLDTIMRQAQDSEIIRLSMDIREGKRLSVFDGHDAKVYQRDLLSEGMLAWADIILCGTNATRMALNQQKRKILGYDSPAPMAGEQIICLHNYWHTIDLITGDPLVNGTLCKVDSCTPRTIRYPRNVKSTLVPTLSMNINTNGSTYNVMLDQKIFTHGAPSLTDQEELGIVMYNRMHQRPISEPPLKFDFGYAITCHKAQGSQFDKVLVIEESFPFDTLEHNRWLYTAVTRASDKLVVIKR